MLPTSNLCRHIQHNNRNLLQSQELEKVHRVRGGSHFQPVMRGWCSVMTCGKQEVNADLMCPRKWRKVQCFNVFHCSHRLTNIHSRHYSKNRCVTSRQWFLISKNHCLWPSVVWDLYRVHHKPHCSICKLRAFWSVSTQTFVNDPNDRLLQRRNVQYIVHETHFMLLMRSESCYSRKACDVNHETHAYHDRITKIMKP